MNSRSTSHIFVIKENKERQLHPQEYPATGISGVIQKNRKGNSQDLGPLHPFSAVRLQDASCETCAGENNTISSYVVTISSAIHPTAANGKIQILTLC